MARLARYGNVPPSEFEEMDHVDSVKLATLVTEMHHEDQKLFIELAKFQAKAAGAQIS